MFGLGDMAAMAAEQKTGHLNRLALARAVLTAQNNRNLARAVGILNSVCQLV